MALDAQRYDELYDRTLENLAHLTQSMRQAWADLERSDPAAYQRMVPLVERARRIRDETGVGWAETCVTIAADYAAQRTWWESVVEKGEI